MAYFVSRTGTASGPKADQIGLTTEQRCLLADQILAWCETRGAMFDFRSALRTRTYSARGATDDSVDIDVEVVRVGSESDCDSISIF